MKMDSWLSPAHTGEPFFTLLSRSGRNSFCPPRFCFGRFHINIPNANPSFPNLHRRLLVSRTPADPPPLGAHFFRPPIGAFFADPPPPLGALFSTFCFFLHTCVVVSRLLLPPSLTLTLSAAICRCLPRVNQGGSSELVEAKRSLQKFFDPLGGEEARKALVESAAQSVRITIVRRFWVTGAARAAPAISRRRYVFHRTGHRSTTLVFCLRRPEFLLSFDTQKLKTTSMSVLVVLVLQLPPEGQQALASHLPQCVGTDKRDIFSLVAIT